MSWLRIISLLCIWSALSAYGIADDVSNPPPPVETEVVSESLEEFLDQALDAGLLSLPGESVLENKLQTSASLNGVVECDPAYPLDFTSFLSVQRYADISPYRKALEPDVQNVSTRGLVKAYLSLGLYAEAIAIQDKTDNTLSRAYTEIAKLLDGYQQADESFFYTLSECHSDGELWLGISALVAKDISGAPLLSRHIEGFRDLPLQLRSDVAALVLPTLRRNGHNLLGKKLLATFNKADVQQSSKLSIQAGFLEVQDASFQEGYDFLSRIAPGTDELLPHLDGLVPLGDAQRAIILEEAYKLIARSADSGERATALKFVLEDLRQRSDYSGFIKVLDMPGLTAPDFQLEVKEYLATQLIADLGGEGNLSKFAAIDMLVNNPHAISGHSAEQVIIAKAVSFLQSQGQDILATKLLNPEESSPKEAVLSARIAYRQDDIEALYAIAEANMDHPDITYLAALAAVQSRDVDKFKQLEGGLSQQAELLVELAEEDAVVEGWILSEQTYESVRRMGNSDQINRLQKVLSLKTLKKLSEAPLAIPLSQNIGNRLTAAGSTLDQFERGDR